MRYLIFVVPFLCNLAWATPNPEEMPVDAQMATEGFKAFASEINASPLDRLPVLNNGRLKPFHTLARESVLFMTGSFSKWGLAAQPIYLGLMIYPSSQDVDLINLRNVKLREALGFARTQRFISIRALEASRLRELAAPLIESQKPNAQLSPYERDVLETYSQWMLAQQIIHGQHLASALGAAETGVHDEKQSQLVSAYLQHLLQQPASGADAEAQTLIAQANLKLSSASPLLQKQMGSMGLEVFYNQAHLFLLAAILYMLVGCVLMIPTPLLSGWRVIALATLPIACQTLGFAIRVWITGFSPVTNMYGTMLWVSLGVALFAALLYGLYGKRSLSGSLWIGSAVILLLTESLPLTLNPDMDPIVAVLRSNFWLTIHVLTITISYAAFTIAMLIGNAALVRSFFKANDQSFYNEYAVYCYRMIQLGVFLLTAGIILGGVWADYSWGRFWGWDPKETWALIADVGFLIILHARYVGWLRAYGVLAASPAAYLLVIMAWYGVNFILASGLHSYGFSQGGATAIAAFVAAQLILLVAAMTTHWVRQSQSK